MKLSKEEIQHIADLARLELSDEEKEIYGKQLSHILDYVSHLAEVSTDNVEPTAQVTGLESIWREDEVNDFDDEENKLALAQSPETKDGQIKVGKIL